MTVHSDELEKSYVQIKGLHMKTSQEQWLFLYGQGSLNIHLAHLKHCCFHQNKVKSSFTKRCSNVRILDMHNVFFIVCAISSILV